MQGFLNGFWAIYQNVWEEILTIPNKHALFLTIPKSI